ncbi:MAG TPA: MotA/TolQ/ExbB proton channel family protein [Candidatus Acidoferrum sp.]|nr:MotA/TolQ/ExbB proton channel family protein [Candidatus Acidoferrum sp.]
MSNGEQFLQDALLNASKLVEYSLIILCLMFAWTVAHLADRYISYLAATQQTRSFRKERETLLKRDEWKSVLVLGEKLTRSHVAVVYSRALREFDKGYEYISSEQSLQAASRVARIARNDLHEQLKRGLNDLSAISRTAPFVGVFGTCIGILDSFRGYAGSKSGYIAFLAMNLAEALVPTTVGLLVGVVATWSYNWQNERLAVFDADMEIASLELERYLKNQSPARS